MEPPSKRRKDDWNDPEFVLDTLKTDAGAMQRASESLLGDEAFVRRALPYSDGETLLSVAEALRDNKGLFVDECARSPHTAPLD